MDTQEGFSSGAAVRSHFIRNDYWGMGYGENALHFRIKPHSVVIPSKARKSLKAIF